MCLKSIKKNRRIVQSGHGNTSGTSICGPTHQRRRTMTKRQPNKNWLPLVLSVTIMCQSKSQLARHCKRTMTQQTLTRQDVGLDKLATFLSCSFFWWSQRREWWWAESGAPYYRELGLQTDLRKHKTLSTVRKWQCVDICMDHSSQISSNDMT